MTATVASGVSAGGGAAMAGNVILGGIIGGIVDGTNGSMNDLGPIRCGQHGGARRRRRLSPRRLRLRSGAEAAPADVPAPAGDTPDAAPQAD